ncbi:RICIN domain-containing protein [Amnibacterium flavum]|uniref:Fibronectin type-III domain-containing protein n=1 Tax=Amnibacterium flavum TaxID=2173173 RepID=A0A2V1HNP2_9MICO|nr:RICIN domain-containing protein [Amnibacterium flavum]PVZ94125.1 hypothetical protein DDQ50_10270 [Amnibacterium flavum]
MTTKRHASPGRTAAWWTAIIGVVLVSVLASTSGTYALWNSTAKPLAGGATITTATPAVTITGFNSAGGTYSTVGTVKTVPVTVKNTGDATLSTTAIVPTLASGTATAAGAFDVVRWGPVSATTECTASAQPASYTNGNYATVLKFSVASLAPGASAFYCVRTKLTTATSGSANIRLTATGTVSTNWKATATNTAAFVAQAGDTTAPAAPYEPWTPWTTNITGTTIGLGWSAATDNVGVTDYEIYRNGALVGTSGGATTYTDRYLRLGTTYTYTVRARDAAGNFSAMSPSVSGTTASWLDMNESYRINNIGSGLCISIDAFTNGSAIRQQPCGANGVDKQTWKFADTNTGNNSYSIMPRNGSPIGLDVNLDWNAARGMDDWNPVIGWSYGASTNQQWKVEQTTQGVYRIVSVLSGKCLDVPNASADANVALIQYTCNGTNAQNFTLTAVP